MANILSVLFFVSRRSISDLNCFVNKPENYDTQEYAGYDYHKDVVAVKAPSLVVSHELRGAFCEIAPE